MAIATPISLWCGAVTAAQTVQTPAPRPRAPIMERRLLSIRTAATRGMAGEVQSCAAPYQILTSRGDRRPAPWLGPDTRQSGTHLRLRAARIERVEAAGLRCRACRWRRSQREHACLRDGRREPDRRH